MSGNSFGVIFRVTTFGESHGPALGCVVDGCPAGVAFSACDLRRELARRKPGGGGAATTRNEDDEAEILSGVFEGLTLGTPIAILIRNASARSADYDALKDVYRPGHADWCCEAKYGRRDHRGGGRTSARETVGRVAAGAVAKRLLAEHGIGVRAWCREIAGIAAPEEGEGDFDWDEAERNSLRVPSAKSASRIMRKIEELRAAGDSAGGVVSCRVAGLPAGLGEPVFEKLDALIAQACLSIGAAKGIEFGSGFALAEMLGSQSNDALVRADGSSPQNLLPPSVPHVSFATNNAGGVLGGISNGMPLEFRVAFKPVPSISKPQRTVARDGAEREISVKGRHDVCVCPRAVSVVEAMTALVLADALLRNRCSR
ncbi:MAG: chorismate synthase [Spirochaetaceae bacterium]|jgi:chorismate synthase|nr:chorismate synthase [Spirochaetaceae bacterium]